jgi:hypothetical protein
VFAGKDGAYPSEAPFKCSTLNKKTCHTNTLAYSVSVQKVFLAERVNLFSQEEEPNLGGVFNSKLACFVTIHKNCMSCKQPLLELKTRPWLTKVLSVKKVLQLGPNVIKLFTTVNFEL